nr:hypothetical protein CFP56_73355 [Quercus suber]
MVQVSVQFVQWMARPECSSSRSDFCQDLSECVGYNTQSLHYKYYTNRPQIGGAPLLMDWPNPTDADTTTFCLNAPHQVYRVSDIIISLIKLRTKGYWYTTDHNAIYTKKNNRTVKVFQIIGLLTYTARTAHHLLRHAGRDRLEHLAGSLESITFARDGLEAPLLAEFRSCTPSKITSQPSRIECVQADIVYWSVAFEFSEFAPGFNGDRTLIRRELWKTPFELATGQKPDCARLRLYGCTAYIKTGNIARKGKLRERAKIGHLVGWDSSHIFHLYESFEHTRCSAGDSDAPSAGEVNARQDGLQTDTPQDGQHANKHTQRSLLTPSILSHRHTAHDDQAPVTDPRSTAQYDIPTQTLEELFPLSSSIVPETTEPGDFYSTPQGFSTALGLTDMALQTPRLNADYKPSLHHARKLPRAPDFYHSVQHHPYKAERHKAMEAEFKQVLVMESSEWALIEDIERLLNGSLEQLPLRWGFNYKFDALDFRVSGVSLRSRGQLYTVQPSVTSTSKASPDGHCVGCRYGYQGSGVVGLRRKHHRITYYHRTPHFRDQIHRRPDLTSRRASTTTTARCSELYKP